MFKDGTITGVHLARLTKHADARGYLAEAFRIDELPDGIRPVMAYVSYTEPGVARGPHEHREQTDVFTFLGPGNFQIYLWDNRRGGETFGNRMVLIAGADSPATLVVPPLVVHGYRNISRVERGMVLNAPDRLYAGEGKQEPVDEIRHEEAGDEFYLDFTPGSDAPH